MKQRLILAATVAVLIIGFILGCFWFAGFNFDKRGDAAFIAWFLSCAFGGLGFVATMDISKD